MVAPKQSAAVLRRNLMRAKGSPEQHKHMDPSQLRCIQRRVQTSRKILTQQKLAAASVPESIGELIGWCETHDFYAALRKHNDPADDYCLPLFSAFVLGSDIKQERQAIHINMSSPWFLFNAIRAPDRTSLGSIASSAGCTATSQPGLRERAGLGAEEGRRQFYVQPVGTIGQD